MGCCEEFGSRKSQLFASTTAAEEKKTNLFDNGSVEATLQQAQA
jgi:hypothetical protein